MSAPQSDDAAQSPWAILCDELIHTRQHIGPKRLRAPGPDEGALRELFSAVAAAPDHEQLRPWRFLVLGTTARDTLAQAFADALLARDPDALPAQVDDARAKAYRGPVLILAVADLRADNPNVHAFERIVSLGCAIQNLLLAAHARGWGSGLTSGRALQSPALRQAFHLEDGEHAVCFISLGTVDKKRPPRARPGVESFVQWI